MLIVCNQMREFRRMDNHNLLARTKKVLVGPRMLLCNKRGPTSTLVYTSRVLAGADSVHLHRISHLSQWWLGIN